MLGLRSAYKEDLSCSAVELTLGTTVRLPGEYFDHKASDTDTLYLSNYAKALASFVESKTYVKPRHPSKRATFIPGYLNTCSHVFIRNDAVRTPL